MIQKELLKHVLMNQRAKIEINQDVIPRESLSTIKKFIKIKNSIIITGIRRCGKSVLLSQIIKKFFKNYYYINFEDERLANFTLEDFEILHEVCIELFGTNKVFFVDEIQSIEGWERWVRRMHDDGFKFFITGSNAKLLSKELATLLTGRHLQCDLYPFSFREFLIFKDYKISKENIYITEERAQISKHLSSYIKEGGFPQYLKDKRIEILQEYFHDIINRDIVERYKVINIKQLKNLARYLFTNSANLTSYNALKNLTSFKSVNTVIKYVSYLENAYLIFLVPHFAYSLKDQIKSPFKVFAIDTALRNSVSFKFSRDIGRLYENIVAIELKIKNKEFYYWKDLKHHEVDFVIKENTKVTSLLQVCYDISDETTKKREITGLLNASQALKCNNLYIITENEDKEETIENKKIRYIPLWKFLLRK